MYHGLVTKEVTSPTGRGREKCPCRASFQDLLQRPRPRPGLIITGVVKVQSSSMGLLRVVVEVQSSSMGLLLLLGAIAD